MRHVSDEARESSMMCVRDEVRELCQSCHRREGVKNAGADARCTTSLISIP
jgi:hypothetical protein